MHQRPSGCPVPMREETSVLKGLTHTVKIAVRRRARRCGRTVKNLLRPAVLSTWTFGTFVGEFSSEARRFA